MQTVGELIDEFIRRRDEALISGDVEKLRAHLVATGNEMAKKAPKEVLEISLHKSRVHWRGCPPEKLYESVWWLHDHGFSLDMASQWEDDL